MTIELLPRPGDLITDPALQVYLLGSIEFEAALALQKRLAYEAAGDRDQAALILCEHPPVLTVGRQGSRSHIRIEPEELRLRRWPIRWVNRGGGCWLQLPGQLAIYSILPLDRMGLMMQSYLEMLQTIVLAVLEDFNVFGKTRTDPIGVWVGHRMIAGVGVAVRDWVSYYGAALNVNPDLHPFRRIRCAGPGEEAMTSLERERHGAVRASLVRERVVEHYARILGFERVSVFSEHPLLSRKGAAHAIAAPR